MNYSTPSGSLLAEPPGLSNPGGTGMGATPPRVRLLCVEDNPDDVELCELALRRVAPDRLWELERVEDAEGMARALARPFDLVLCDYHLPRFSPQAALALLQQWPRRLPLVVVTRAIGEQAAVEILRLGARDYVTKDRLATLPQVIDRVLHEEAEEAERARLAAELAASLDRTRALSARLLMARERERHQVARELDDEVSQTLAGMLMHLHAARATQQPETADRLTDHAIAMAQSAIEQVKTLAFALHPPQLSLLGIASAIESTLQRSAEPLGLEWSFRHRGDPPAQGGDTATLALRVVHAAVDNAGRHGRARHVAVRTRFRPDGCIDLLVADDGRGWPQELLPPGAGRTDGTFRHLVEHAELVGSRLSVRSRPGRGTAVRARLQPSFP